MFVHQINPIMFSIGPINFYWYGFMYFLSIKYVTWKINNKLIQRSDFFLKKDKINYLVYYICISSILGGRIGYVLFYDFVYYYQHILSIFKIWEGGMSFHGSIIGGSLGILYFCKHENKNFLKISDIVVLFIPVIIAAGRIGNFINGELWGRVAIHSTLAIIFPKSTSYDFFLVLKNPQWKLLFERYGALPRHPSQLYEFFFEGIILHIILIFVKNKRNGLTSSIFLITYGMFRFFLEMFREPDAQIGLFFKTITLGQLLSIPMILSGIFINFISCKKCTKNN